MHVLFSNFYTNDKACNFILIKWFIFGFVDAWLKVKTVHVTHKYIVFVTGDLRSVRIVKYRERVVYVWARLTMHMEIEVIF